MFHIVKERFGIIGLWREVRRTEKRIYVEHVTGERGTAQAYYSKAPYIELGDHIFLSLPDEVQARTAFDALKRTLQTHRQEEYALRQRHQADLAAFKTADWGAVVPREG